MFKKILLILLGAVLMLLTILLVNTFRLDNKQVEPGERTETEWDGDAIVDRFSRAIQYQTISGDMDDERNTEEFYSFLDFIEEEYPLFHSRLEQTMFSDLTPLYFWEGSDPSLDPILLMGHYDVVPVDSTDLEHWQYAPFSGEIEDGYIWGRGTLDNKNNVMALLETAEHLLQNDFRPQRSIYFIFGHDEEIGGYDGAVYASRYFQDQDIRFYYVLDEGGVIIDDLLPVDKPVAIIGVAEKGYLSLELIARSVGGHSSMPPADKSVVKLSEAIVRLDNNPLPARIDGATEKMFDALGNKLPFSMRMLYANRWLTEGTIIREMSKDAATSALIRTTMAPTMLRAGVKDNVLPTQARGVVNFRLLPGDDFDTIKNHVRNTIEDESIEIQRYSTIESQASMVSSVTGTAYRTLQQTITDYYQDVYVAPYIVVGATDSRHFIPVADNVYRFSPVHVSMGETNLVHGINERIRVDSYLDAVGFYTELIRRTTE